MADVLNVEKDDDNLESFSASNGATSTPAPEDDGLPEKFKGKKAQDIAVAYEELEKRFGRQGEEIGTLRKTYDEVLRSALSSKPATPAPAVPEADDDSQFFINPREAIRRELENNPLLKELQTATKSTQQERAQAAFAQKHPDYEVILVDPEFDAWVRKSPVRLEMMRRADREFDLAAGDEVFSTYKELKAARTQAKPEEKADDGEAQRQAQLRAATVPSGNSSPQQAGDGKKRFKRSQLVRLMVQDRAKYESMSDEILAAYAEGRVD